jgi:hypothetical protein
VGQFQSCQRLGVSPAILVHSRVAVPAEVVEQVARLPRQPPGFLQPPQGVVQAVPRPGRRALRAATSAAIVSANWRNLMSAVAESS